MVLDEGDIVGGAHSHQLEMAVPGASAVTAGVANIAVQPTHRRRGVLTRMMRHQIHDLHERGEALAALFASESVIYGRFGYGVGSLYERWIIDRQFTEYAHPTASNGQIRFIDPEDIPKELPDVFRRSTVGRPGVFHRAPHHWERDSRAPEHRQSGPGGLFYAAYTDGDNMDGYVTYRTNSPNLVVNELIATTREATAALWRFCFDMDLMTSTEAIKRPVDDPLPWMLADPRRLQRSTRDALWLRLIDVSTSLKLRRYMHDGRLVFEVRDDICPWNQERFELEGSTEGATCRTTKSSPDLVLGVPQLASAYLGAVSFSTLAQAGLAEERTPGALLRADRMFATEFKPWTPHNF